MKKLLLIGALVLFAAAAFAQTADAPAPAPKYEIYGSTFFDYQMSGTEMGLATPSLGNFNFSKLRIGFKAQLADGLKSSFEFDPRNGEFRQAFVDWIPMDNLTLTVGKTNTNFQQIVGIYGAGRSYLVGAKYAMPGLGWASFQLSNASDISYISGNYMIFPTPTAAANQTQVWSYKQDPNVSMTPAIVFKPDFGKDLSLEVGLEGQFVYPAMPQTGVSADAYATVAAMGFTFTNEVTCWNLTSTDISKQRITYYAQLTYNAGFVAPTAYFLADETFYKDMDAAIGIELPFQVAKGFKITPLFTYAVAGYNAFEGYNAVKDHLYNKNDWTLGIRFDYSYSAKF